MSRKSAKILLTGLPGCGKTTAIMKIAAKLKRTKPAGFYTRHGLKNGNPFSDRPSVNPPGALTGR